jgi:hypothetical protein
MAYVTGDTVVLEATFNVDGADTDPTTVELKVKRPSGTVDTYTSGFGTPATGKRTKSYSNTSDSGTYWYRWTGTGAAPGVEEGSFRVEPSNVV